MRPVRLLALLMCLIAAMPACAQSGPMRFRDVPANHWAIDYVRRVTGAGLMQGTQGQFHGASPVNRYQLAQVLSRMMDRMGSFTASPSTPLDNQVVLQLADEVASLNVSQSTLEQRMVELRHDVEAIKSGELSPHAGPKPLTEEQWIDRMRSQTPIGLAALAVFASANFLQTLK